LGIVFISYVLIGFLGLSYIIKSQAPKYVKENLNVDLSIQKVDFNPFLFKMNIHALELKRTFPIKNLSNPHCLGIFFVFSSNLYPVTIDI